jgi:hypothetical protein
VRAPVIRQRVFLTFAADDLARARPVAARLLASGGIALDQALTSEPFDTVRGEIVRASLLNRLRRCASALCLYGADTSDDPWVRWSMETAAELDLPLLGAALPGSLSREAERYLRELGAELLPLNRDTIIERAATFQRRPASDVDAASLAETLHLMRHPLR